MTRWLEAARQVSMPAYLTDLTHLTPLGLNGDGTACNPEAVKTVKSVKSGEGVTGPADTQVRPAALHPDAAAYLAFLHGEGPSTYGAAASSLGWGATRAWQAEARLRAAGLVHFDTLGRAIVSADNGNGKVNPHGD